MVGVDAPVGHEIQVRVEQLPVQFVTRQATPPAFTEDIQYRFGALPGKRGALLRPAPLRTARARYPRIRLKQAPKGSSGMQNCWVLACAGDPAVAGDVQEADSVRRVSRPVSDPVVLGDRVPGGAEPLFPLAWAAWLPVGVQQVVPAYRAAAFLRLDQAQGAVVQRGLAPAAPVGPV